MEYLELLKQIDLWQFVWSLVILICACGVIISMFEKTFGKVFNKLGLETKNMREKREDREKLKLLSDGLIALQQKHTEDETMHKEEDERFRATVLEYIKESSEDRKSLHQQMTTFHESLKQYGENRINDRAVSIDREKRLNDRIDGLAEADKSRDVVINDINKSLQHLTNMFVNKDINDMRWEILDFCSALANDRTYNKEAYSHIFKIYDEYEQTLKEHGLENGYVDESVKFAKEKFREGLADGTIK